MKKLLLSLILIQLSLGSAVYAKEEPIPSFDKAAFIRTASESKEISLSLKDCIGFALKSNSEILIRELSPKIEDANVLVQRSKFEPSMYAGFTMDNNVEQSTSTLFGVNPSKTRTNTFNAGYSELFTPGTRVDVDFLNSRVSSNALTQTVNPAYDSNPTITLTQPLLKGVGVKVNTADFVIAKNRKEMSEYEFEKSVMSIITDVKRKYLHFQSSREQYRTARISVGRVKDLYAINKQKYAKGLASDVDLLESEADVARAEQLMFSVEKEMKNNEDSLKLITNMVDDPSVWNASIAPSDPVNHKRASLDLVDAILKAFDNRPDYAAAKIDLKNRDISVMFTRNGLLPSLDVTGSLGLNGLSDDYGKTMGHVGSGKYPDMAIGAMFTLPLGNDEARGKYRKAKLEKQQAILAFKRLEQRIILEIRDAVRSVETRYLMLEASRIAKEAEEKNYTAQVERFKAGLVSTHDIMDYQERLTTAEVLFVRNVVEYNIAIAELAEAEGLTLVNENIKLAVS